MPAKRPLRPSREFSRRFVRAWPGGNVPDDCRFEVLTTGRDARLTPHFSPPSTIRVGAEWLRGQAIKPGDLT